MMGKTDHAGGALPIPDRPVTPADPAPTTQATFAVGDERADNRVVDALTESYPHDDPRHRRLRDAGRRWDVAMHFAEPPTKRWCARW